jgi:hypothetical protein
MQIQFQLISQSWNSFMFWYRKQNLKSSLSLCFFIKHSSTNIYGEWRYSITILDRSTILGWIETFTLQPLEHQGRAPHTQDVEQLTRLVWTLHRMQGTSFSRECTRNHGSPAVSLRSDNCATLVGLSGNSYAVSVPPWFGFCWNINFSLLWLWTLWTSELWRHIVW